MHITGVLEKEERCGRIGERVSKNTKIWFKNSIYRSTKNLNFIAT